MLTQETIAILAVGLPCLGGLIHIVWELAKLRERVSVMEVYLRVKSNEQDKE